MSTSSAFEVYFDFDNTITSYDILDDLIQRFSVSDEWRRIEDEWEAGKIGSRECLERQLGLVRVTEPVLEDYLRGVKIDPAFKPIIALLASRGIEPVIISDSFRTIIERILAYNGVTGIKICSNEIRIDGDVPTVSFPHFQAICSKCGNCKTAHLLRWNRSSGVKKVYVGDGHSDICPAGFCEILFAKGTLLRHYATLRPDCIPFEDLGVVHDRLKSILT